MTSQRQQPIEKLIAQMIDTVRLLHDAKQQSAEAQQEIGNLEAQLRALVREYRGQREHDAALVQQQKAREEILIREKLIAEVKQQTAERKAARAIEERDEANDHYEAVNFERQTLEQENLDLREFARELEGKLCWLEAEKQQDRCYVPEYRFCSQCGNPFVNEGKCLRCGI